MDLEFDDSALGRALALIQRRFNRDEARKDIDARAELFMCEAMMMTDECGRAMPHHLPIAVARRLAAL